jgi:hypothetical protein
VVADAVGGIVQRDGTISGIEYDRNVCDFFCFCECKYADISIDVTYDKHRNQLARTIENALCFYQGVDNHPDIHVALVTREIFKTRPESSRLYQYKIKEYAANPELLLRDISGSCLTKRNGYPPDLGARLRCLKIHWVSFQSLVKKAPESPLKEPFAKFVGRFDGSDRG